jgi:hypothetical protein
MVISLTICQWNGKKTDKKATREVEVQNNAQKNSGRFVKNLVDEDAIGRVTKQANALRNYFYEQTLAWGKNGERLLPSRNFLNFMQGFTTIKGEFDAEVSRFVQSYDSLRDKAERTLGLLFNPDEYPSSALIEKKFGVETDIRPIENADDFRVQISKDEADKIRQEIADGNRKRIESAIEQLIARFRDAVEHIHERLADPHNTFRDSLIENLHEIRRLAPLLNFSDDPRIDAIIEATLPLCQHEPERIRHNSILRQRLANHAGGLLKTLLAADPEKGAPTTGENSAA